MCVRHACDKGLESLDNSLAQPLCARSQIMGPEDSYLLQYSKNTGIFWADQRSLALGASFKAASGASATRLAAGRILPEATFSQLVEQGYQASQTWHQGTRYLGFSLHGWMQACKALPRCFLEHTSNSAKCVPCMQGRWWQMRRVRQGTSAPRCSPPSGPSQSRPSMAGVRVPASSRQPLAGWQPCRSSSRTGRHVFICGIPCPCMACPADSAIPTPVMQASWCGIEDSHLSTLGL